MAASSESVVAKKLAALQLSFEQQLPGKIAEIEQLWKTFCRDKSYQTDLVDLHRMAHSLAGSSGSFGAEAISRVAQKLVQNLSPILKESAQTSILVRPRRVRHAAAAAAVDDHFRLIEI